MDSHRKQSINLLKKARPRALNSDRIQSNKDPNESLK